MIKFGLLLLLTVAATKAAEEHLIKAILKNVASRKFVLEKRQSDPYECHHWTDEDEAWRDANGATDEEMCERSEGYVYTVGDDSLAPGCGGCWCCKPTSDNIDHCDAVYPATADPRELTSPNYPDAYPSSVDSCITVIYANGSQQVQLEFEEFDLESNSACSYDYLEVRDGDNSTAPLLGKFCGSSIENIVSSGYSLWLKFHSDGSVQRTGFLAYFTVFNDVPATCSKPTIANGIVSPTNDTIEEGESYHVSCHDGYTLNGNSIVECQDDGTLSSLPVCEEEIEDHCGAVYPATAEPRRLTSPGYPSYYSNNVDSCVTLIYANGSQLIQLNFEEFDLESNSACSYDYLEIRDGESSTSPLLGKFCGSSSPGNISSSGSSLWVKFHSDSSVQRNGFSAYFTAYYDTIDDTEVEVFPEFHLLNPDGIMNGTGLILARVGDEIGLICECGRPYGFSFEDICHSMGYDRFDWHGGNPFNRSEVLEFPKVITSVVSGDNSTNRYYYNATCALTDVYCPIRDYYISCANDGPEPTEPPTAAPVKEVYFTLLSYDPYGDLVTEQPEGLVIAMVVTDEDWDNMEVGSVCDDSVNDAAANVICTSRGYARATEYGNNRDYDNYISEDILANVTIIMDQFNCPDGAGDVEECDYDLYRHDCSAYENLVVFCESDDVTPTNDTDNEYELVWAGMYSLGDDGRVRRTNNGLVIIVLVNTRTGEEHVGTVCDDGFSDASADIGCKLMGYEYAYSWENHRDYQHIPASMIEEYEIGIVADEFRCPEGAETLDDCSYNLLTHDCSHQEDIVLDCAGEDPFTPYPTDYTRWTPTEGPTWGPTASDLDDEIAVKFGGLEVKLKVNPKKGRAKVADVLEEIAYFLG